MGEAISDYGTRVSVLLNKIIPNVMERNPGEKGRERCEEYIENAIKNFVRGLDRDTLIFMKVKSPPTLDCPQLERGKPLSKFCKYCEVKGHEIRECFLKEKHDKEREAKQARYLTKVDLNSKKSHHAGETMTSNKTQSPKIVYSSASNNQTEGSEILQ